MINSGELGLNNFFIFSSDDVSYQPVRSLATINMIAYQGAAASKRIFDLIDKPIKIKNEKHLPDLKIENCNISFKNVNFKYDTTEEKAIKNVNLKIEGTKITALVGKSGAGKSTIINLIPRFMILKKVTSLLMIKT